MNNSATEHVTTKLFTVFRIKCKFKPSSNSEKVLLRVPLITSTKVLDPSLVCVCHCVCVCVCVHVDYLPSFFHFSCGLILIPMYLLSPGSPINGETLVSRAKIQQLTSEGWVCLACIVCCKLSLLCGCGNKLTTPIYLQVLLILAQRTCTLCSHHITTPSERVRSEEGTNLMVVL